MSRPLRLEFEGAVWHITSRGNERKNIFRCDADRIVFLAFLAQTVKRFDWFLRSWVLMTNHFHLVLETPQRTLSRGMHWLNTKYASYFNRRYKRVGHLFQGRFDSKLIERETHLYEVLRYVVLNPVRAEMVEHPADYRWSSYRALAGLEAIPDWLAADWLFELNRDPEKAREAYCSFVAEKIGDRTSIWDNLVGQMYLGSEAWIEKMRAKVESRPRSDEHSLAQRLIPRAPMASVVRAVSKACDIEAETLRDSHGGAARMLAAWIGWNKALLRLREIAAGLRLGSSGHISSLVRQCEMELARDKLLRSLADRALGLMPATA